MKLALSVSLAVVLLLQAESAGQNLLVNGNLDDPGIHESDIATGWTLEEPSLDSTGTPVNSATFASFADHTTEGVPGGVGLWYRSFEGGLGDDEPFEVDAHLYQDVPGTAGAPYALSAWYRYEANYPGTNPFAVTDTILAMEFLDAGSSVIGSVIQNVDDHWPGNSNWFQVSINGVAPAGTAFVRARSSMISGVLVADNPQSAYVDDFSLVVPEPASAIMLLVPALAALCRRAATPRRMAK